MSGGRGRGRGRRRAIALAAATALGVAALLAMRVLVGAGSFAPLDGPASRSAPWEGATVPDSVEPAATAGPGDSDPGAGAAPDGAGTAGPADGFGPGGKPPPGFDPASRGDSLWREGGGSVGPPRIADWVRPAARPGDRPPEPHGGLERIPAAGTTARLDVADGRPRRPRHERALPVSPFPRRESEPGGRGARVPPVAGRGLLGEYYDLVHATLHQVPDLEGAEPTFRRIDANIDFPEDVSFATPFDPETFVVRWTGEIHVPNDGVVLFTAGSDDGVRLRIDGRDVIVHGQERPYGETEARVELTAGWHPLEIVFYENGWFAACRLWWTLPGETIRIVEPAALRPPPGWRDVTPPVVAATTPAEAFIGEVVEIAGGGFDPDPLGNRVTFAGAEAEVLAAATERLTVRVPVGARTGDVTVEAGGLTSPPAPFEVHAIHGLWAEFFVLADPPREYPLLEGRVPDETALLAPLHVGADEQWPDPIAGLEYFAARIRGLLWIPEEGAWTIAAGGDDGTRLRVDGRTFVDLPGSHGWLRKEHTAVLDRGFHSVEIDYFESGGVSRLQLFWRPPGAPDLVPVPAGSLFPPPELAGLPAPRPDTVAPAAAAPGDEVVIAGSGFGADPSCVRVVFAGGVEVAPLAVEDGRLRVRVPLGAASGELAVRVGARRATGPVFTRSTPLGLTGRYHRLTRAEVDRYGPRPGDLEQRRPEFTRVDHDWQFTDRASLDLPFTSDDFAVHWTGTLAAEHLRSIEWQVWVEGIAYVYVDGRRVVDAGAWRTLHLSTGRDRHEPGRHTVDVFWFNRSDEPRFHLLWSRANVRESLAAPAHWFEPE